MTDERNVVLLEGGEGTAKTSIADMLVQRGYHRVKLPSPKSSFETLIFNAKKLPITLTQKAHAAMLDYHYALQEALASTDKSLVLDRGPLSTWAYQTPNDVVHATDNLGIQKSFEAITHIYIGDVRAEVGLKRETNPNEVSKAGLEFHRNVNAKYRLVGHMLEYMLRFRRAWGDVGYEMEELKRMLERAPVAKVMRRSSIRDLDIISTPPGSFIERLEKDETTQDSYINARWQNLLSLGFEGLRRLWFVDTEKYGFEEVLKMISEELFPTQYAQCA